MTPCGFRLFFVYLPPSFERGSHEADQQASRVPSFPDTCGFFLISHFISTFLILEQIVYSTVLCNPAGVEQALAEVWVWARAREGGMILLSGDEIGGGGGQ